MYTSLKIYNFLLHQRQCHSIKPNYQTKFLNNLLSTNQSKHENISNQLRTNSSINKQIPLEIRFLNCQCLCKNQNTPTYLSRVPVWKQRSSHKGLLTFWNVHKHVLAVKRQAVESSGRFWIEVLDRHVSSVRLLRARCATRAKGDRVDAIQQWGACMTRF